MDNGHSRECNRAPRCCLRPFHLLSDPHAEQSAARPGYGRAAHDLVYRGGRQQGRRTETMMRGAIHKRDDRKGRLSIPQSHTKCRDGACPHLLSPISLHPPHLISPHPISSHLTPSHLTSSHLISPISSHLTPSHLTSPHLLSPRLTSSHPISSHLTSPHLISPHLPHLLSPRLVSSYLTPSHLTSSLLISRPCYLNSRFSDSAQTSFEYGAGVPCVTLDARRARGRGSVPRSVQTSPRAPSTSAPRRVALPARCRSADLVHYG